MRPLIPSPSRRVALDVLDSLVTLGGSATVAALAEHTGRAPASVYDALHLTLRRTGQVERAGYTRTPGRGGRASVWRLSVASRCLGLAGQRVCRVGRRAVPGHGTCSGGACADVAAECAA